MLNSTPLPRNKNVDFRKFWRISRRVGRRSWSCVRISRGKTLSTCVRITFERDERFFTSDRQNRVCQNYKSFKRNERPLGENCALATDQSVDCRATILFTISLISAKVWNRGFNLSVFGVGIHKKSPNIVASAPRVKIKLCAKQRNVKYSIWFLTFYLQIPIILENMK